MSHPPMLAPATEPLRVGDALENPCTGEKGVLVKVPWEGGDGSLEADLFVQPGGAVVGEHVHENFAERFTVREGRIGFRLDGEESVAGPGEVVEIPRGHWHDWWNAGDGVAVARVWVSDGLRFTQMIETLFGLARDGHTNAKGMPDPLQLAMFATEFRDVLTLRRPPALVQSALFGLLRPIARARGYHGTYPQYGRSLLSGDA
ncbi:MAG TPA: cupin domain-containing protein [Solirubrobacterales bacterium]|nr:cupin domain-containing protein [Solirubrobacterales bacterium]